MSREHGSAVFPDSAFLVGGLLMMALLQLFQYPLRDGLVGYLTPDGQVGLSICLLLSCIVCLVGLVITRREALTGGWIQAGGLLGIEVALAVYTYLLYENVPSWYLTPTAWLLFGLMSMFASRCIRVVLFTISVFRQASLEVKQEKRRP